MNLFSFIVRGSERNTILDLIRRRIKDERVLVRKAAIQVRKTVSVYEFKLIWYQKTVVKSCLFDVAFTH